LEKREPISSNFWGAFFISGTRIPAIERAVTSLLILKWRLFLFPEAAFCGGHPAHDYF